MQYRTMPNSDEKLSVLGFGCMRLPTHAGGAASSLINKDEALRQINYAIESGVNYLDTAYPYHMGASEKFLGQYILKGEMRKRVKLATKLPCMIINKKSAIEEIFNKQLERLQTDYIDYYMLHALDGTGWEKMLELDIIEFMDKIRRSGQVRKMGFSFHGQKEDFMRIVDSYDWDFAQVQFNILDLHFQAGIEGIEYAHSKGMGIIVMEPLRGGSLVGKIPAPIAKLYKSAPLQRSAADWALRWIWNHPAVTMVLSGMNRMDHIEENMRIASDSLPNGMSEKELEIVEEVRKCYLKLMQVGCTGCAYCMPCPAGIDIPAAFKNLNDYHMFSKAESRFYHASYLGVQTEDGKPRWTKSCINCGKCERKCPQQIAVRECFKQVSKDLEGPTTKGLAAVLRFFMGHKDKEKAGV